MKHPAMLAVIVIATALLAACGSSPRPDPAACKAAMTAQYAAAITSGTRGTEPPACKGVPLSQLERFAAQIIAAAPMPSPSPGGPDQFVTTVTAAGLGGRDLTSATAAQLIAVGKQLCDGLREGESYQDAITVMMTPQGVAPPAPRQAAIWVDAAIRNLCPQYAYELPASAP